MNPNINQVFSKRHVLITGGMGFIGSALAHRLFGLDAHVTIIDSMDPFSGGNIYNLQSIADKINFIKADIGDKHQVGPLLKGQDYLFNLAGQISHVGSMNDPFADLQANGFSQLTLLELCRKHNPDVRIVYSSTRQIYGKTQYLPVDENHSLAPVDMNGVSKLAGECYHLVSHSVNKLPTSILRMTNVYGPRMRVRDAYKSFIGFWFRQLIEGKEIPIFGTGKQIRDFNYVEDVVDALLFTAANPKAIGETYNLGAEPTSLIELAELMIEINGSGSYHLEPFPLERKGIEIGDYYGNYSKIHDQLGWSPHTSLIDGLTRTLEYYRDNRKFYFL
jgi:UDP-glucose 4-epimerase